MLTEVPPTRDPAVLSADDRTTPDHTTVAMLTLRWRALSTELAELEASEAPADEIAGLVHVRERLQILVVDRQRVLEAELAAARQGALEAIAAAHADAARVTVDDEVPPPAAPVAPAVALLDPEVLAAAIAAALDCRAASPSSPRGDATTSPAKKSSMTHALHADVLLSVLAMVIVIVVLIAWSS